MSTEENKAIVHQFEEELWKGNFAIFDELTIPTPGGVDRETVTAWVNEMRQLTDFTFSIDDMVAEDDKVWFRWTIRGTHTAPVNTPWGTAEPTGKSLTSSAVTMFRLQNGKIVEDTVVADALAYFSQLGAISMPGQSN